MGCVSAACVSPKVSPEVLKPDCAGCDTPSSLPVKGEREGSVPGVWVTTETEGSSCVPLLLPHGVKVALVPIASVVPQMPDLPHGSFWIPLASLAASQGDLQLRSVH